MFVLFCVVILLLVCCLHYGLSLVSGFELGIGNGNCIDWIWGGGVHTMR